MAIERKENRYPVSVQGRYRTGSGVPKDVDVLDISESGCRFFDRFGRLTPGSEISFRVGKIGPIIARVRWSRDQVVGVEFENPIYGPVLDHIRAELAQKRSELD